MRNIKWVLSAGLLFLMLSVVCGCGYTVNKSGALPGGVQTVYVMVFDNLTSEAGLETMIATSLVSEITRFDSSAITSVPAKADAIIKGTIRATASQSIAKRGVNVAAERMAVLTVDVQLVQQNGVVLWQVRNISDSEPYLVFDDKMNNQASRYNAYNIISARLAERIYSQMTDLF